MPLPNFICVGAQKSGTTTLYDILVQHPDIFLPEIKETKFFHDNNKYEKGLSFYEENFFKAWKGEKAIGEIDPEYMYFESVPERIYRTLGKDVKLIFMLRNPVDRAYSHYWMSLKRGYETETFERAVELEGERLIRDEFHKNHFSYVDRGFYAKQIKRYLTYFCVENMFFVVFEEDFLNNRRLTIEKILTYTGVRYENLRLDFRSNPASLLKFKIVGDLIYKPNVIKKIAKIVVANKQVRENIMFFLDKINRKPFKIPEISTKLRKALVSEYFIKEIKELEHLINRDLGIWYKE